MATATAAPQLTAQGGFNTGRLYTAAGQMVYWWAFEDGWLYFKDVSRMVDGYLFLPNSRTPRAIMAGYDNGPERSSPWQGHRCEYNPDYRVPEGFEFGEGLRI